MGSDPELAVEFNSARSRDVRGELWRAHTIYGDIADLAEADIPRADLVIGGPPCQGFSNLGSKDINDPRNQLWREYLRVVSASKPRSSSSRTSIGS